MIYSEHIVRWSPQVLSFIQKQGIYCFYDENRKHLEQDEMVNKPRNENFMLSN